MRTNKIEVDLFSVLLTLICFAGLSLFSWALVNLWFLFYAGTKVGA
jgi:hypothetical protein